MSGLRAELSLAWQRTWGGRLLPLLLAVSVLLLAAVRLWGSTPPDAAHAQLARFSDANEIIGFALAAGALLIAYLLLAPDIRDEFESLSQRGRSRPLLFAAGRAMVGAAGLLMIAVALCITTLVLNPSGRYAWNEAVHVLVLCLDVLPLFMLSMVLMSAFGRIVGLIAPLVFQALGNDAAYQRGAMADGFIDPSSIYSLEQFMAWLAPRPLNDSLPGIIAVDQSIALHEFPVRQGHSVWGWDLIQVSGVADVALFAVYLGALLALLVLVCRLRAAHARTRFQKVGGWLGAEKKVN